MPSEVDRVRTRLDHPVIDSDGHHIEFLPLVKDRVREIGDDGVAKRFEQIAQGLAYSIMRPKTGESVSSWVTQLAIP